MPRNGAPAFDPSVPEFVPANLSFAVPPEAPGAVSAVDHAGGGAGGGCASGGTEVATWMQHANASWDRAMSWVGRKSPEAAEEAVVHGKAVGAVGAAANAPAREEGAAANGKGGGQHVSWDKADDASSKERGRDGLNQGGGKEDGVKALPAQLLRWNSFLCEAGGGEWQNLPSVVTWLSPSQSKGKKTRRSLELQIPEQNERKREPSLDDFDVLRLVGQGGFGKVYQVRKRATGRIMALKAMRKHLVITELNVEGTQNERMVLESVQHPFVVRLWSAFHDHGRLYLLMDWHNGGQLLRLIEEHAPFGETNMRFYLAEIVMAIEGLHERGIVHRDMKPENVLITSQGHIIVTDFGASKIHQDSEDIHTNSWVGTELYMAPEQLQGKVYGRVVDWWAVGVLAWEMCTGDNPFYHKNPEQVAIKVQKKKLSMPVHLGPATHSLFKGLLSRDPEKRLGKGGSADVKAHAFFKVKGFDWKQAYNKEVTPPYFDPSLVEDQLNHSRSNEKYTNSTPVMSPVMESMLSPKSQSLFNGFEWVSPAYSPAPNKSPKEWRTSALGMPELFLEDPHEEVHVPETVDEQKVLLRLPSD